MTPSIGRIVHVRGTDGIACRAAIITALDYGRSNPGATIYLNVFNPHDSVRPVTSISLAEDSGRWHDPRECPDAS